MKLTLASNTDMLTRYVLDTDVKTSAVLRICKVSQSHTPRRWWPDQPEASGDASIQARGGRICLPRCCRPFSRCNKGADSRLRNGEECLVFLKVVSLYLTASICCTCYRRL